MKFSSLAATANVRYSAIKNTLTVKSELSQREHVNFSQLPSKFQKENRRSHKREMI